MAIIYANTPKATSGSGGAVGATGATGATGAKGDKGDKGDVGIQGIPGAQGSQGIKGDKGDQGLQGIAGEKGDIGLPGATGAKGDKGDTGAQGIQGIQGIQGLKGDTGASGSGTAVETALPYVSGRSYMVLTALPSATTFPTIALIANTTYTAPMFIPRAVTINQLSMNVTTAVAGSARIGIYSGYALTPQTLLAETGLTIDTSTVGIKSAAITSLVLQPGWYTIALVSTATASIMTLPQSQGATALLGQATPGTSGSSVKTLSATLTATNAFPASLTFTEASLSSPIFWFRVV